MKMFLEILSLIIAVIIFLCLFFYSAEILLSPSSQQDSLGLVCARFSDPARGGENCFQVELAKTKAQREKGLMDRKELDKDKGMLFIFEKEGIYPFWMKNTLIPLDIIWIDADNKVVFISQNTKPCESLICLSIIPPVKAKYVLEINAGMAEEIGLKISDKLEITPLTSFYGIIRESS